MNLVGCMYCIIHQCLPFVMLSATAFFFYPSETRSSSIGVTLKVWDNPVGKEWLSFSYFQRRPSFNIRTCYNCSGMWLQGPGCARTIKQLAILKFDVIVDLQVLENITNYIHVECIPVWREVNNSGNNSYKGQNKNVNQNSNNNNKSWACAKIRNKSTFCLHAIFLLQYSRFFWRAKLFNWKVRVFSFIKVDKVGCQKVDRATPT